ncbi:TIGR03620 family F420-dependent LLM class oxidoreductase [Streptomyces sp. VRA16 Mangrove soil]|uniref:TIGR03620 family F420-dependent LLM class oxidoreductase n=1 Tax=Streptomyces sp. VRA16 Mangrove soil TaxID=2817434 RepID=UPI001A9F6274|nr:TIGR03620 family F420-dependent LLM class oxidoreductase [Streptomyces sp. VRA16 Mangrove soil]MBO1331230.1 TIGR03620 family F420-dependent LLM class oxidoreductase [Streptomyces sp. VRA16 Mangrove soil]
MNIGRVGIWSPELRLHPDPVEIHEAAAELDQQGWGALWIPGLGGGDILGDAERLLRATENAAVVTGVLSIWRHPADDMAAGHARLRRDHGHRLLLGLGVSDSAAARQAGGVYRPLAALNTYLDRLDQAPEPVPADERLIAAMGPKLTELAGRRSAGTHPFLVTPEFTATARQTLGRGPLLAPYQAVVVESDPARARDTARGFLAPFIAMGHYANSLKRQGFTEDDLAHGGSDRLIDAVVAWGDPDAIGTRVRAHFDAGATHVALHAISADRGLPLAEWRALAPLVR